eukprot:scaffold7633_cov102-Isochrysis_galbana.AAC.1
MYTHICNIQYILLIFVPVSTGAAVRRQRRARRRVALGSGGLRGGGKGGLGGRVLGSSIGNSGGGLGGSGLRSCARARQGARHCLFCSSAGAK